MASGERGVFVGSQCWWSLLQNHGSSLCCAFPVPAKEEGSSLRHGGHTFVSYLRVPLFGWFSKESQREGFKTHMGCL